MTLRRSTTPDDPLRLRAGLLKIGARVVERAARIRIHFASATGRDYSLGWRLVRGGSGGNGGSLELSFEGRRRESANDDTPPVHEVGFKLTARF